MSPQVLPPAQDGAPLPAHVQQQELQVAGGGGGGGDIAVELLDAFLAVQRERAAAYRRFEVAFRAYLSTSAEGPYRCVGGGGCCSCRSGKHPLPPLPARAACLLTAAAASPAALPISGPRWRS